MPREGTGIAMINDLKEESKIPPSENLR